MIGFWLIDLFPSQDKPKLISMTTKNLFSPPNSSFSFLDSSRLIKSFPALNQSYIIVEKDGNQNHLLAFDHALEEMVCKDEVKGILDKFYPVYKTLMSETYKKPEMDFDKIAFGIGLGMTVYHKFKYAIIHFRRLHTYAFNEKQGIGRERPLGDPDYPRDHVNLGFVFKSFGSHGTAMFTYDGYRFPEDVMRLLIDVYEIVEPKPLPEIYKRQLTDAYVLKGRSV
jgi:hypothetical protein